ncbi:mitochondrial fusion [Homalodisca vitripennis]|nr:mitochondrial fusion [Homalodisca vitripennis]
MPLPMWQQCLLLWQPRQTLLAPIGQVANQAVLPLTPKSERPAPPIRKTLRTEMVHCSSDVEYLCKLHCIRLAFQWLFQDTANWTWFANNGRQVLYDLLLFAEKVIN